MRRHTGALMINGLLVHGKDSESAIACAQQGVSSNELVKVVGLSGYSESTLSTIHRQSDGCS